MNPLADPALHLLELLAAFVAGALWHRWVYRRPARDPMPFKTALEAIPGRVGGWSGDGAQLVADEYLPPSLFPRPYDRDHRFPVRPLSPLAPTEDGKLRSNPDYRW